MATYTREIESVELTAAILKAIKNTGWGNTVPDHLTDLFVDPLEYLHVTDMVLCLNCGLELHEGDKVTLVRGSQRRILSAFCSDACQKKGNKKRRKRSGEKSS